MEKDLKEIISLKFISLQKKDRGDDSFLKLDNFDEIKTAKKDGFVYFYHPMFQNVRVI
jgi:hypothetical protein